MKKIAEKEIREIVSQVLEESIKRLMEGDDMEDDSDDSGDDGGVDDIGGDDMGDMGGDDGGAGGEGGEGEDPDTEEEIDKLSDKVDLGFNAPKNLTLNDGTTTNIAVDSADQQGSIDADNERYEVTFEKGNWDTFSQSAMMYSQKVTTMRQTVVPLVEKALIELLENSGAYDRTSFDFDANSNNGKFQVTAEMHYQVDLWLGTDFEPQAVQHDSGYIYQTLIQIPGIDVKSVNIDTKTGDVQIIVSI